MLPFMQFCNFRKLRQDFPRNNPWSRADQNVQSNKWLWISNGDINPSINTPSGIVDGPDESTLISEKLRCQAPGPLQVPKIQT